MKEEVEWNFVDYQDNQPVLDLIAKRPICILGLLDEGCSTGAGKDDSVLENFHSTFANPKYKMYEKPNGRGKFGITHYAGMVYYTMDGFVEKNKDELSADITALLEVHQLHLSEGSPVPPRRRTWRRRRRSPGGRGPAGEEEDGEQDLLRVSAVVDGQAARDGAPLHPLSKPNQTLKAGDWDKDFMFKQPPTQARSR